MVAKPSQKINECQKDRKKMKMKQVQLFAVVMGLLTSAAAFAYGTPGQALDAAEDAYGNDPMTTKVKTIGFDQASQTVDYHVVVGIGNAEDGAHYYDVKITGNNAPVVTEIDRF
jgi:hypothetical protein